MPFRIDQNHGAKDDLQRAFRGRRVLVTGHTGFKGSWLSIWLHRLGSSVVGYSLPPHTAPNNFTASGVRDLLAAHYEQDIRDADRLRRTLCEEQPEVVFHLAAQPLVRESYHTPRETFDTNVMGTVNLLEAVRVYGKPCAVGPVLWHIMKGYARYGYTDFVLCLGYKGRAIKRYFLDYDLDHADFRVNLGRQSSVSILQSGVEESWNVTLAETGLDAMTGCRVKRIERYIEGDEFMLTYGDGVADVDLGELVEFHRSHGGIGTVTAVQAPGRFGELALDATQVREFSEKPLVSPGRISGGFFVFNRTVFDYLQDDPELILEQQPLVRLARDGELHAFRHDGFWHPMDSSRDYQYLNETWNSGKAAWNTWSGHRDDRHEQRVQVDGPEMFTAPFREPAYAEADDDRELSPAEAVAP